ncbi:MAG: glutamate--tRNA ligase [Bacteroidetes bacterium]|nr:glutamate--tRNA ligase [Bacteroidota bacterium]
MNNKKVRVRFAPSPTGGLHLGGVRTVLFNYLFAKHFNGDFILRIEDTDQTRFVAGAEEYIYECLNWCGLQPDESPKHGGAFAPYKQSERKTIYKKYAEQLITQGNAYYAFDTPEELDVKRKTEANFQYNLHTRMGMKNSLSLSEEETKKLLAEKTPFVVRIKIPENEEIKFTDMIRGEVKFNSNQVDDKVLLKADGMPTYHLAVVVDDYLMKISHAFRGEEWLPSAPVHILLWQYLFGIENMPQWAHLPLILKPDGNGKLSKRDGDRLGFPVFAMDWTDPKTNEKTIGFKERGFLPEAFINMLAMMGWNDGTDKEIFSLQELIDAFSMERVHKAGAKFDYEKAKWFNHEWIKKTTNYELRITIENLLKENNITVTDLNKLEQVIDLVKDRCTFLTDFVQQSSFFFKPPETIDIAAIQPKWNEQKNLFFAELIRTYELTQQWQHEALENEFKEIAAVNEIKPGELMLPFRIMLVGGKFGPHVFNIAEILGKDETIKRIKHCLTLLK